MLVFSYAVEVDARDGVDSPELGDLMAEAATAYKARAECLLAKGDSEAAARDNTHAEKLETRAKKMAKTDKATGDLNPGANEIVLRNGWKEAITVVIEGKEYPLQVGDRKKIAAPAASFRYEVKSGSGSTSGTLEAGKAYRIGD
jgi:hypothetical protein